MNQAQAELVLKAFVRDGAGQAVSGIQTARAQIPEYRYEGEPTPICALAQQEPKVARVCREFYNGLSERQGPVICPWGIRLNYSRTESPIGLFGLFVQGRFDPVTARKWKDRLRSPTKRQREQVERALNETERIRFEEVGRAGLLREFQGLVQTLLAGWASEAITAVAHEIQTPVQGALGDLIHLAKIPADQLPPHTVERIERLQDNVQSVLELARRIPFLIASDLEQAPGQMRMVPVHKVVGAICGRLHSYAEEKHVHIDHGFNDCARAIEAVPDQLEMALTNVIQNAVKYSFTGTPERFYTVQIGYSQPNKDTFHVIVQNFGTPITDQEIRQGDLFRLGYRGRYSGDRGRGGTGSGLYIAQRLARAHGGDILVESHALKTDTDVPVSRNVFTVVWRVVQSEGSSRTRRGAKW